ncbi:hypothetical protein WN73_14270 [Bradyrhizobium sp. CCBAU 45394]|nr:hypothetical protein [Bradyrhizobium sp. CCBAU 45394]
MIIEIELAAHDDAATRLRHSRQKGKRLPWITRKVGMKSSPTGWRMCWENVYEATVRQVNDYGANER